MIGAKRMAGGPNNGMGPCRIGETWTNAHVGAASIVVIDPRRRHTPDRALDRTGYLRSTGLRLRGLVMALLETACRVGELLDLQWKQIRWAHNEIYLPGPRVKGQRDRFVPMSRRLRAALEMLRRDPAGREVALDGFVFGTETGKKIKCVKTRGGWRAVGRTLTA